MQTTKINLKEYFGTEEFVLKALEKLIRDNNFTDADTQQLSELLTDYEVTISVKRTGEVKINDI